MPVTRFTLSSPVFRLLEPMPVRYTALGANVSPPLRWSGAPPETEELALVCEDPDAPFPKPFVHWMLYGIPPTVSALPEGIPQLQELELPVLARQGRNSLQQIGYTGPNPPFWHGAHHYIFKLFALKLPLELWPGAGREDFLKALEGHVLAETRLVAIFEKSPPQKVRAGLTWAAGGMAAGIAAWGAWKATAASRKRTA